VIFSFIELDKLQTFKLVSQTGKAKKSITLQQLGILLNWKDKPVFITGAAGFIGSHVTERFVEAGADVSVFLRASSSATYSNLEPVKDKIKYFYGNLIDPISVKDALSNFKGQDLTIIHLGAQAHVGESWQRPVETFEANFFGTMNTLQAVVDLDLSLRKLTFAGTSEEYGNANKGNKKYTEFSELNPESPYATAKVAADFICRNYHNAYGIPTVITRMFNNYGPRQNARYVTGTIISQALTKDKVELGALKPTRDFLYVKDGAKGHMLAAEKGKPGNIYAFGYEGDISIGDWAKLIVKVGKEKGYWKDKEVVSKQKRFRPGKSDINWLGVDCSYTKKELSWEKEFDREHGVKETIDWYANNQDKWVHQVDWR